MRRKPNAPINTKMKACTKQATKEMVCFPKRNIANNFGITALVKQHSKKEKMLRKKYMGVFRRALVQTMETMTTLPVMEARYASRCTEKRSFPRCWAAGNPSRINSCTVVPFPISIVLTYGKEITERRDVLTVRTARSFSSLFKMWGRYNMTKHATLFTLDIIGVLSSLTRVAQLLAYYFLV